MAETSGVLTIDLDAIAANWASLRARHAGMGGGEVGAAVKADAYGLGAARVAPALAAAGCRHFFVAQLSEGMALRPALGPEPMIMVLNGFPPGADEEAGLIPVLNSPGDIAAWSGTGRDVLLHLDTGMARLGLTPAEAEALAADPSPLKGMRVRYVMTHLACADEPQNPMNATQAARFAALRARLPTAPFSFANSAGLFLGRDFASSLARPGCALYGINPTPGRPNPMRPVVRLSVPVLQVRDIPAGTPVGYGASWVAPRPSRIATVAAGYADGYLRSLSGRAIGRHNWQDVPLVGRVSMDLSTFDVTDHPAITPGSMIELIGPGNSADEVALQAGTIGYEVLTALGTRYRRAYTQTA
ncbi:alanine racemase [Roseomonas sp. SSH11]|uniref:Alanine racemase n=1 Tax=Pararoseomonas baculiformis TaxID=2820812 RepID=A0ABS4AHU9_9PROT|nr:alanine racemase [Pararoseomonas baculiformis]MBP0446607.1 alanine racemase [Pararoseomonas baculiformis]